MYKKILSIMLPLTLSFTSLSHYNDYEDAFYAISSLQCYLDELIPDNERELSINFNEADIADLWKRASAHPRASDRVHEAYSCYSEAKDQASSLELYTKAQQILTKVWSDLNPYLEKQARGKQIATHPSYPNFDDNSRITDKMREKMRPYLLPLDHELKPALDEIFDKSRAIQNPRSFAKAGFITIFHQRARTLIRVAKHEQLPGHLVKVYLDSDTKTFKGIPGWNQFMMRCQGAENIRRLIKEKHIKYFTVPDKWLYPPSTSMVSAKAKSLQHVILLVTNANLVSQEECATAWKEVRKKHLDELYCILSHGFASAYLVGNIPYTKNGTFACIDTQYPKRTVRMHVVPRYLSPKMQAYWNTLVRKGGAHPKGGSASLLGS